MRKPKAIIGEQIDDGQREHLMECPGCGERFDMRNLGEVLEHDACEPQPDTVPTKQHQPKDQDLGPNRRTWRIGNDPPLLVSPSCISSVLIDAFVCYQMP